jgi:hypothetical protein
VNVRLFALAVSAVLSACVATPQGSPVAGSYERRGLPFDATETVAIFVSTEVSLTDADKAVGLQLFPISTADAVSQGLREGFHSMRSDGQLALADEALRKACFDSGTKSIESGDFSGAVLVVPNLSATQCRALVEQRGIRYLVSAAGRRHTSSRTNVEFPGISVTHSHTFRLLARAFDTTSGSSVREGSGMAQGDSSENIFFFYFMSCVRQVVQKRS